MRCHRYGARRAVRCLPRDSNCEQLVTDDNDRSTGSNTEVGDPAFGQRHSPWFSPQSALKATSWTLHSSAIVEPIVIQFGVFSSPPGLPPDAKSIRTLMTAFGYLEPPPLPRSAALQSDFLRYVPQGRSVCLCSEDFGPGSVWDRGV